MLSEMMCRRSCQQQQQQQQQLDGKGAPQRDPSSRRKHGWSKSCRGRWPRGLNLHHQQQHHHHHPHPYPHPARRCPRPAVSLRPVNVKGNRARGMRAPKNTNQFLMHEKYQMLHMRSDSVGSDSGSCSDSDVELTDMDSYLGVLENARGALLDSPNPHGSTTPAGHTGVLQEDGMRMRLRLQEDGMRMRLQEDSMHLQGDSMRMRLQEDSMRMRLQEGSMRLQEDSMRMRLQEDSMRLQEDSMRMRLQEDSMRLQEDSMRMRLQEDSMRLQEDSMRMRLQEDSMRLQEDSMQYFPSEDDLIKSQNFMQRDFVEFCDILTP